MKEENEAAQEETKPEELCRVRASRATQPKKRWVPSKQRDEKWNPGEKWNPREQWNSGQTLICFRCGEEGHKASCCSEAMEKHAPGVVDETI